MITPSLETCKRLKEAGWKWETELFMHDYGNGESKVLNTQYDTSAEWYYAPTAEEMADRLPKVKGYNLIIKKLENEYSICYQKSGTFYAQGLNFGHTLSEALAELTIWALNNGYIKQEV